MAGAFSQSDTDHQPPPPPGKQKRANVKALTTATQEDDKEYHKILQCQDSYHTKVVKALKYLKFTQDTIGHDGEIVRTQD